MLFVSDWYTISKSDLLSYAFSSLSNTAIYLTSCPNIIFTLSIPSVITTLSIIFLHSLATVTMSLSTSSIFAIILSI